MKKQLLFLFCLCISVVMQAQVSKTVVCTAGGLSSALTATEKNAITDLTISGTIDYRDFVTMRDSLPLLATLDLNNSSVAQYNNFYADQIPYFAFCDNLYHGKYTLLSINLPKTVKTIRENAFRDCINLTSISNPSTLNVIGESAFIGCTSLKSVVIPSSIDSIGNYAFSNCKSLRFINIPSTISTIKEGTFNGCSSIDSVTIPSSITVIERYAFSNSGLKSFIIPSSVTTINDYAFENCINLKTILIPSSVTLIGQLAFHGYFDSLIVDKNNNNYSSKDGILYNKSQSQLIQCPVSTAGIFTIPSTVQYINTKAFDRCNNIQLFNIPSSVNSITNNAFTGCRGLINVDINNVTYSSENGILFNKNKTIVMRYPTSLKGDYNVPTTVTSISNFAFEDCMDLTSIYLPPSVTFMGNGTFHNCNALTESIIPYSVSSFGYGFLNNCTNLKSVIIPSTVDTYSSNTINDCNGLESIYNYATKPANLIAASVFGNLNKSKCILYVPVGTKTAYQSANIWKDFTNIIEWNGFSLSKNKISLSNDAGSSASMYIISNQTWTATSDQTWLTVTQSVQKGNGNIVFTALENTGSSRTATVTVTGSGVPSKTITITQGNIFDISTNTVSFATENDSIASVQVTSNIAWTSVSDQSWVTISSTNSSGYNGIMTLTAESNKNFTPRTATITVSASGEVSKTITVTQIGASPTLTVSTNTVYINNDAVTAKTVLINSNTSWNASSDQPWLTLKPDITSNGNDTLLINASINSGTNRTALVSVSASNVITQIINVTQGTYFEIPKDYIILSNSGKIKDSIEVYSSETWTFATDQSWLTINSSTPISGNGFINYSVLANTDIVPRIAIITVSVNGLESKKITIVQDAASPLLSLSSSYVSLSNETSNSSSITITSNLNWTASSDQTWLTVNPNTITFGNNTLNLIADNNLITQDRYATITISAKGISSQKIYITQSAAVAFCTISANTVSLSNVAGSTSIDVTSNSNWMINNSNSWVTITPSSSSGNGTITVTVSKNVSTNSRIASVYISSPQVGSSQMITITQKGATPTLTISEQTIVLAKDAGNKAIIITSNTLWNASSDQSWLTVSPSSGNGNGTLTINTTTNPLLIERTANVTVSVSGLTSQIINITQSPGSPNVTISSSTLTVYNYANSKSSISVTSNTTWTANSNQAWLTLSPSTSTGNSTLTINVEANPLTTTRTAVVTITAVGVNDQTITITQNAGYPSVTLSTQIVVLEDTLQSNSSIDILSNTIWYVSSAASWLTVSPASNNGNGTLIITAAANSGVKRNAQIDIIAYGVTTQTIYITQKALIPLITVPTTTVSLANTATGTSVAIKSNITWNATTDVNWLTIIPANGNGDGTIAITPSANQTTIARTATVTITSPDGTTKTFTVSQAAGDPIISVPTTTVSIANTATATPVSITSNTTWDATTDVNWLTLTPTNGNGDGTIAITPSENQTTIARTATITISSPDGTTKTFTVSQTAGESVITVPTTTVSIANTATATPVSITSNTTWNATTDGNWLTLSPANGNGDGTIAITPSANPTTSARTATITISSPDGTTKTFTVSQAAGESVITVPTTTVSIANTATATPVSITSNTTWDATTDVNWLTLSPANGNGDGTISVTPSANPTTIARTATVTITSPDGTTKTFTVSQAGADPIITLQKTTISFTDTASTDSVIITSNGPWSANSDVSWLSVSPTSGSGNDTIIITAEPNTTGIARTGTVTISSDASVVLKTNTTQTITVTQAAKTGTGFTIEQAEKKGYHIIENTVYFENSETSVYTILGQRLSAIGDLSITLQSGIYIVQTSNGSDKIVITKR
jgi:hypothetical protein